MATEQNLIDLAEDFKDIMDKKNEELTRLKKFVALIYGLIRTTDEMADMSLISAIRSFCSDEIEHLMNID